MSNLRITASVMFAVEMIKAATIQHRFVPGVDFTRPWEDMELSIQPIKPHGLNENEKIRKIYVKFRLQGVDTTFGVNCWVETKDGIWSEGTAVVDFVLTSLRITAVLEGDTIVTKVR